MNDENKITPSSSIIKQSEAHKIVQDLFKQQEQQMQSMLFNRHRFDCDIFSCQNNPCFIWEHDKIVATSKVCGICGMDVSDDTCIDASCEFTRKEFESGRRRSVAKKLKISDTVEAQNSWEQEKYKALSGAQSGKVDTFFNRMMKILKG